MKEEFDEKFVITQDHVDIAIFLMILHIISIAAIITINCGYWLFITSIILHLLNIIIYKLRTKKL